MAEQPSNSEEEILSTCSEEAMPWSWADFEEDSYKPPSPPQKYVFRIPRPDTKKTHEQYVQGLESDPAKAEKMLKYEKQVIETQRTRLRAEFFNVYREMGNMDKEKYSFYEIHEARSFTLSMKGIKVELVGLFRSENGTHYLLKHDAQDKTIDNPAKVLLDFQRLKDPPAANEFIELKGSCFWKDDKSVVDVHSFSVIYPNAVDYYVNFLREVKLCANLKRHCAARRGFNF